VKENWHYCEELIFIVIYNRVELEAVSCLQCPVSLLFVVMLIYKY